MKNLDYYNSLSQKEKDELSLRERYEKFQLEHPGQELPAFEDIDEFHKICEDKESRVRQRIIDNYKEI